MFDEILQWFSSHLSNLTDALVYCAIAGVTLIGVFKCLIPLITTTHALRRAGATIDEESTVKGKSIIKADLYDLGLIGPDSVEKRKALCKRLELPEHLSANALVEVLNLLMSREELEKLFQ